MKTKGLGRGLDALLSNSEDANDNSQGLMHLPIDYLSRGKYQPRRTMDQEQLKELASSIEEQGIIQPILVRELGDSKFEIIAGEDVGKQQKLLG